MATKQAPDRKHAAQGAAKNGASNKPDDDPGLACNLALIIGELVTEPDYRTVTGGTEVLSFSLTVRQDGARTTSVPLVWYDPPQRTRSWTVGSRLVATGSVVRRFYHAGGAVAARTEVNVSDANLVSRKATARRIIRVASDGVGATLSAVDG